MERAGQSCVECGTTDPGETRPVVGGKGDGGWLCVDQKACARRRTDKGLGEAMVLGRNFCTVCRMVDPPGGLEPTTFAGRPDGDWVCINERACVRRFTQAKVRDKIGPTPFDDRA